MRIKKLILDYIDWEIIYITDATCGDTKEISEILKDIKCPEPYIQSALEYLEKCNFNKGFTYSNSSDEVTVILLGVTKSLKQTINTIAHEVYHFIQHLVKTNTIKGEENEATLMGNTVMALYSSL